MSCAVNVSGAWKYAKQAYVNVGGSWKPCQNIYTNVSGAWKPLYTYSYQTGDWGACSANCGGGTQTRMVTCQRRDATNSNLDVQTVADSFCAAHGLAKPAASQECNTHSCVECKGQGTYASKCDGSGAEYGLEHYTSNLVISSLSFYGTRIYWDSTAVFDHMVQDTQTGHMDSLTVDGYVYTKNGTSSISDCSAGEPTIQYVYRYLYSVCKTPV